MTHDQHDEDLVRHQLQALDGGGAGAGGRGGDSSKSTPVSGQLPGPTGTGTTLRISTTAAVVVRNVPPGICTTVPVV